MSKEIIDLMIEGGQAKAGPSLAQPLAPLGINIQQIITKINEKTSSFNGMKVPVKVTVETEDKSFDLEVGTPPISELIKKEIKAEKGSGTPDKNKIGNIAIEQAIKLAKMKQDSLLSNNFKSAVKSVIGSCNSLGVLIEGKSAKEINREIDSGKYDSIINSQRTELSKEKQNILAQQLIEVQERMKKELAKLEAEKKAEEEKAKKLVTQAEATVAEADKEGEKKEEAGKEVKETKEAAKPAAEKKEAKK
ncbi:50S ribosomal protein L11 [Candidatus Woesearchaeota archaeon]|nr:50S ribosomal protein L11 [Candidatus Woesearchaeota archaeon]